MRLMAVAGLSAAITTALLSSNAAASEVGGWPREAKAADGTRVIFFQPQIDRWDFYVELEFHMAAEFIAPGGGLGVPAALHLQADTETNLQTRTVTAFNIKIVNATFPDADEETAKRLTRVAAGFLPKTPRVLALDRVLAHFESVGDAPKPTAAAPEHAAVSRGAELRGEVPVILVSSRPAVLILFDGDPLFVPIKETGLLFAANTNWDLFLLEGASEYYLLNEDAWLVASEPTGPWKPAGKLPKEFWKIPVGDNWAEVHKNLPGRHASTDEVPRIFVSMRPAELISIEGEPQMSPIPGTRLLWVTNTDSDLFRHTGESSYYYLVSGRWFRARELDGPWTLASGNLPADFAAIPTDHARARVRVSVPGTAEAEEAVMLAQIPQKAEVKRSEVTVNVTYNGDPEFKPIGGTSMSYAANTSFDVIRVGDLYYTCFQGVWFVSTSSTGPWVVTDLVPKQIYTIPPSSPKYHVTYVYVYDSTPDVVVVGYTSGYWGVYVSWGCVVYGTGYYYPPYVYYPPRYAYPVYYPYPHSYGVAAYYNPYTGTYGRGAAVYGPYGGYGWGAAYNPQTGTYARGVGAYGPYEAGYARQAYNPSTDTYGATYQRANPYASWGESVVSRGDQWAHTGHYSDSRGTVAGFETSEGAKGVGAVGDDARGFVAQDGDNNLYAGKDGNVYRHDDDGWSKYDDGDWQQVERAESRSAEKQQSAQVRATQAGIDTEAASQRANEARSSGVSAASTEDRPSSESLSARRTEAQSAGSARSRTASTQRSGESLQGSRSSTLEQLDRDARARSRGAEQTRDYNSWRGSGGGRSGSRGSRTGGRRR